MDLIENFMRITNISKLSSLVHPGKLGNYGIHMARLCIYVYTMLPDKYKAITLLERFKVDIKEWVPECKCRLCKTYVAQVGFVDVVNQV